MITKYFTYQYLFGPSLPQLQRSDRAIYFFGIALFILGILIYIYARTIKIPLKKDLASKWGNVFFYTGLLLGFWYFLRYELVVYLSAHWIAFAIILIALIWAFFVLKYQLTKYKRESQQYQQQQLKSRYL